MLMFSLKLTKLLKLSLRSKLTTLAYADVFFEVNEVIEVIASLEVNDVI